MNIYLIRDQNLGKIRFNNILSNLNHRTNKKKPNPVNFIGICVNSKIDVDTIDIGSDDFISMKKSIEYTDDINPLHKKGFDNFYDICNTIRRRNSIETKDICILLTNTVNKNHFLTWCNSLMNNIFIQTSHWDMIFGEDSQSDFPIMYEINAWVLRSITFQDLPDMKSSINSTFKGDIMDLCEHKEQITLKMRSAYISDKLLEKLANEKIEKYLLIKFVIDKFERFRLGLVNREMSILFNTHVTLCFTHDFNDNRFISIEEFGNMTLGFDLAERVVYRLLLENEEGIHYDNMKIYKKRIFELFCIESSTNRLTETVLTSIYNIFDFTYTPEEKKKYLITTEGGIEITKTVKSSKKSFNEKVSKINGIIRNVIPSGVVKNYLINNNKNKYSISLDRSYVEYN
jgi:hypothetical protein